MTLNEEQFNYIIKTATIDQLRGIIEIVYNVMRGVCFIGPKDKRKLEHYKSELRSLITPDLSTTQRKKLLIKIKSVLPIFFRVYIKYVAGTRPSSKI